MRVTQSTDQMLLPGHHRPGTDPDGLTARARPGRRAANNLLAQGLPPIRLITSLSQERPCCVHHASTRLASTGSGRSRDASSASSVYPRRFSRSTTYCLLYCCRMTITKPLYQPDATVAQRHIRRVAALRRRWLPVTALGLSLTGLHPDGLADLAAFGRTPTLNAAS
jgi:hypothetical protein